MNKPMAIYCDGKMMFYDYSEITTNEFKEIMKEVENKWMLKVSKTKRKSAQLFIGGLK